MEEELNNIPLVLFTSGTMGVPKGVMLSKSAIVHNLQDSHCFVVGEEGDRFLFGRGFFYSASIIGGLLMNLVKGIDMYCMQESFQPRRIVQELKNQNITMYKKLIQKTICKEAWL